MYLDSHNGIASSLSAVDVQVSSDSSMGGSVWEFPEMHFCTDGELCVVVIVVDGDSLRRQDGGLKLHETHQIFPLHVPWLCLSRLKYGCRY